MYASINGVLRMTAVLQHRHRFATPSRSGRPQTPASPRDITCCVVGFSRGNALGFSAENETDRACSLGTGDCEPIYVMLRRTTPGTVRKGGSAAQLVRSATFLSSRKTVCSSI